MRLYPYIEEGRIGRMITKAIAEGMAPFRLKQVDILCDYDIDHHEYRIIGTAVLTNGYTIEYVERVGAWDLVDYPDREFTRVAELMFKSFRYREPFLGVPDNIELGEN